MNDSDTATELTAIRQSAMKLLARREHSCVELQRKLLLRGFAIASINQVLEELAAQRWQSDQRFADAYVNYRSAAGMGPRRIIAELYERGIRELPLLLLEETSDYWQTQLEQVWHKKYGRSDCNPALATPADRLKQQRFLMTRGFAPQLVSRWLNSAR